MARTKAIALAAICLTALGAPAHAVQVLYTFEGDSGTTITDKLTGDGAQNPTVLGSPAVVNNPANAAFGDRYVLFPNSPATTTVLSIPGTASLGTAFTLAAMVDESQNDWSRLFSAYDGGGVATNELIFDFDPSQFIGFGLRAFINGVGVTRSVGGGFADSNYHHLAATYDNGQVRLFLDGSQLGAAAAVPGGAVNLMNNLRFGEDYPPTLGTNEAFEGRADDIFVYDAALAPTQIKALARHGASAFLAGGPGIHYSAEGDSGFAADKLIGDGVQDGTFTTAQVSIDNTPANARFGGSSLAFGTNTSARNTVVMDDSRALTDQFTLSAFARYDSASASQIRLFTNYDGAGAAVPGELLFDFNPAGGSALINGIRVVIGGAGSLIPSIPVKFDDGKYHHLTMTYDNGQVRTYVDGVLVAQGTLGSGAVTLIRDLQLGEDAGGSAGTPEQFIGRMDDVLVLRGRALSKGETMSLANQGVDAFLSNPTPIEAGILYTGAPGNPGDARDSLIQDGRQEGVFHNAVSIDTNPANARFGPTSFAFAPPSGSQWNTIELPGSAQLGDAFTLAAFVDDRDNDFTRLFSAYLGSGPVDPGELLFDFNPSGTSINGLRVFVNGVAVMPASALNFADDEYHHLAMTYDDGLVKLYLDGTLVGNGTAGSGPVNLIANLRVGEDLGGFVNEQLIGNVDDVLLLRRVLSDEEIWRVQFFGAHNALIPEPGTLTLLALGGLGMLRRRRRRSRR